MRDPAKAIAVANLERQWQENGKIGLPGYFQRFSVKNAVSELTRNEEAANKEAHKNSQRPPTALEQNGMKLLMDLMRSIAPDVVSIFAKSSTHYAVITSDKILGELVKGRSYRSKEVYLSESLFVGDFATAIATFLHEHAHIFGQDGSRGFTDALTEMLESVVRHRGQFDILEAEWGRHSAAIEEERLNAQPSVNDLEIWLAGLDDQELRALLAKVPAMTLKRLRKSAAAG